MSDAQAESENDESDAGGSWVDNLIVHATNENGGTIYELRLRIIDPERAAAFQGIDIVWEPDTRRWVLEVLKPLRTSELSILDLDGLAGEAMEALDTDVRRRRNVN